MGSFKFVDVNLYFWVRGFKKCGNFFLILNFSYFLEKSKILIFFKKLFSDKTNSINQFLQLRKLGVIPQKTQQITLNLRVLSGKLTLISFFGGFPTGVEMQFFIHVIRHI